MFGFVVANVSLTSRELSDTIGISIAKVFCLFTGPGRPVPSGSGSKAHDARPLRAAGQGGILMLFLWQLMANYGEFQVDLFGDYLHRRTDISLFGAALMA